MAQWLKQLTFIQEVVGSNSAGDQIFFFENQYFLHTCFFKSSFDGSVTWHSKHVSKRDLSEIKRTLSGNSIMVIAQLWVQSQSFWTILEHFFSSMIAIALSFCFDT